MCMAAGRREAFVLDMDSSVSPTHGEQALSVWNGHFECTCYTRCLCSTSGDLERGALRPGDVHSADCWQGVLDPVVARHAAGLQYLEASLINYAIRLPANRVLQERIGHLLKRPVGAPAGPRCRVR